MSEPKDLREHPLWLTWLADQEGGYSPYAEWEAKVERFRAWLRKRSAAADGKDGGR